MRSWLPLSYAANSVNRAMGQPDLYPFILSPTVVGLRRRVSVTVDPKLAKDQARVTILKLNGEKSSVFVEHAVGSLENPMSDRMIEDKFMGLVDGILPAAKARAIVDACWRADTLGDAGEIARHAVGV